MQPTYFIDHGGGACFFLDSGPMRDTWGELEAHLRGFAGALDERPRAVLVVSGHWQEARPTVNAGAAPPLLFDYGGFPAHTYRLAWPAPDKPDLAMRVRNLLGEAGIESGLDASRGWDHGVFVPMRVMFPSADVATVQLSFQHGCRSSTGVAPARVSVVPARVSLQHGLGPGTHLAIGRALRPLRDEGVLIAGSGQTYRNMTYRNMTYRNMRGPMGGSGSAGAAAEAFGAWLREAVTDGATRARSLMDREQAPGARQAQPHEDHLLPLMVAAGAASGKPGQTAFHGRALGKPISGFRFG